MANTTASWTPSCRADIAGKEHLYQTARVIESGEYVKLIRFAGGMFFAVGDGFDGSSGWYHWEQLDSYTL